MKKAYIALLLAVCVGAGSVAALDVDEIELSATKDTSVEFINYEGPHSKIETLEEIMGIGTFLGEAIAAGAENVTYAGRYRVIHAAGPSVDEGLDADIFIVLPGAEVDHIRNLRYILAGFFMAAYDYSMDDGLLLGEFVTIYNAVYRGKLDFFGGKYKQIVTRNLTPQGAGISTLYTDWPGKTEMVIPLTEDAAEGGIGSLDTDALTDERVIDEMRTQDDLGLDSRKDMTELKEREVEKEQEEIEEDREVLEADRDRIADERERIDDERDRIDTQRDSAETDAERARLDREAEALDRQEDALDRQEEDLDRQEADIVDREREQAERVEQIQQEREDIAADERDLMERESDDTETAVATATGARGARAVGVFLEVRSIAGESLGRIVHVEGTTVRRASTVNSIRNQRFEEFGQSYVVVAGTTAGQGAVRLMTIDKESLETGREGSDDIYEGSFLVVDGANAFAVTGTEGAWKLGRFDSGLVLRQASELDVFEDSAILVVDDIVYVVGSDGMVHALSKSDLSDTGTVQ